MDETLIRMDTDETMDIAAQMERISDEMDSALLKLRTVESYLQEPAELTEALQSIRRKIRKQVERTEELARCLRRIAEQFEECEGWLRKHVYTQTVVWTSGKTEEKEKN